MKQNRNQNQNPIVRVISVEPQPYVRMLSDPKIRKRVNSEPRIKIIRDRVANTYRTMRRNGQKELALSLMKITKKTVESILYSEEQYILFGTESERKPSD